ncbi:TadE family protein [uncultured Sneathiella sp.]|uniref:TadE/TadG family type IV pilus assembly protein n=1 Tax=uncultured Sneathiella sp. TaxID=879315 RepID=UPI0025981997|nr:TadE family protein [uncultured Sneathiella sp.]
MRACAHQVRMVASDGRASLPVELAVILPLVFALVFGVVDVSRVLLARSLLDHLAVALSDEIKFNSAAGTEGVLTSGEAEARLVTLAPDLVGSLVDVSRLSVTVSRYESLADFVGASPSDEGTLTAYRLDYGVTLITPFVNYLYNSADVTESALVVVKNGS